MCRPLGESHEEACPGGHIGPPLRDGGAFRTNGYWCRTTPFPAGRDGARPLADLRALRLVLNSEVIGQNLNLTSCSFRAQSAAREVAATLCNHP